MIVMISNTDVIKNNSAHNCDRGAIPLLAQPKPILIKIFSCLPFQALCTVAQVSKRCYSIATIVKQKTFDSVFSNSLPLPNEAITCQTQFISYLGDGKTTQFSNDELTQLKSLRKNFDLANEIFFKLSQDLCRKWSIEGNSKSFGIYAIAVQKVLASTRVNYHFNFEKFDDYSYLLSGLANVLYCIAVDAFVNQDAEKITLQSFADHSKIMSKLFGRLAPEEVETMLRRAALAKHKDSFKQLEKEFAKTGEGSKVQVYAIHLIRELETQRRMAEARHKELCGEKFGDEKALLDITWKKYDLESQKLKMMFEDLGDFKGNSSTVNMPTEALKQHEVVKVAKTAHDDLEKERLALEDKIYSINRQLGEELLGPTLRNYRISNRAFYREMQVVIDNTETARKVAFNDMDELLRRAGARKLGDITYKNGFFNSESPVDDSEPVQYNLNYI